MTGSATAAPPARAPARRPPPVLYALVGAVSALAYVALWLGGRSPWARYIDHRLIDESGPALNSSLFVVSWTVMVTAMMLPTALPLLDAFGRVVRRRPERARLALLLVGGFLGVWAAFGLVLTWVDLGVHLAVSRLPLIADQPWLISAPVLVAAGFYQFSDLKRQCLTGCRSPRSLIMRRWSGGNATVDAVRIGADYGWSCLGCCWTLMLVLFALGAGNVAVMLGFGLVMALEKNVPGVAGLTPVLGAVLVAAGVGIALAGLR